MSTGFMFGSTPLPAAPAAANTPFIFGAGAQNTTTIPPFGNTPASGFSTNQATNTFGTNLTGTPVTFVPLTGQAAWPPKTTTSNIFGNNNTAVATNPFDHGTNTVPKTNRFGTANTATANRFVTAAPVFGTTAAKTPFGSVPVAAQSPFGFTISTNTPGSAGFAPQPVAPTNKFGHPTTATPFTSVAPTTKANMFNIPTVTATAAVITPLGTQPKTTSVFPPPAATAPAYPFGGKSLATTMFTVPTSTTAAVPTNIVGAPAATTATTFPNFTGIGAQPPVPATTSFSFPSTATSILNTTASSTTTAPIFNPQSNTGVPITQTQPVVTSSSNSAIQQQFLAASLLDPYANRGKKVFNNAQQIQLPAESTVVSTLPTTTTSVTTSTTTPVIIPIQSNSRKISSAHSSVDVNFKLKPVSSSPTPNDDIKSLNQQSTIQTKSPLTGNFTDEEELVLLSRKQMSKLRITNDMINSPVPSEPVRSLYPLRRLADLEKLPTTTTVNNEPKFQPLNNIRSISPIRQSTITPKQRLSNTDSNLYRLPILTRDDYYMKPSISELKSLLNAKGECIIQQFTIGHEQYGSVTFYGQINVSGLNLDEIIEIKHHEVIVYPDDNNKPSVGEELNLPARITLFGIYPTDRTTREEVTDIERLKAMNYNDHLREITKKFDGEFINYGFHDGSWTFTVKHFTRYGLDEDLNEEN